MLVKVKYQQMNFIVKALAAKKDCLALSSGIDDNWLITQSISYNSPDPVQFGEPCVPTEVRRAINLLAWSPDGRLLATAFDRLTIWEQMEDTSLRKVHDFKEHSLEITAMTWSQDGTKVATSSLDSRIVIVDVVKRTVVKSIECANKVVGIIWDPFDKYLACLCFDNVVMVWKVVSWELCSSISLNFPNISTTYTSKREDRKIDWSPDFRYLLVPSLDDRVVPVVCALDRHQGFKVSKTFVGPFSSVNVVRFSPCIYSAGGSIFTVFAMGDNDGNISVWRCSDGVDKPLILLKNGSGELIEDITWSSDGQCVLATTMKKYLVMAVFEGIGVPLSEKEKDTYLNQTYGGTKQVYQGMDINIPLFQRKVLSQDLPNELKITYKKPPPPITKPQAPTTIAYTAQQTIITNGKKKIVPQMQVKPLEQQIQQLQQPPQQTTTHLQALTEIPIQRIKQPPLLPLHYIYQLPPPTPPNKSEPICLTFEPTMQMQTLVKCLRSRGDRSEEVLWADQLESRVRLVKGRADWICIYTEDQLLHLSSRVGRRVLPPIVMPGLCYMSLDEEGDLMLVQENGDFSVLQLREHRVVMDGDMRNLPCDTIQSVFLSRGHDGVCIPHVVVQGNLVYSYQKDFGVWVRLRQLEVHQIDECKYDVVDFVNLVAKPPKQKDSFFTRLVMEDPNQRMQDTLNDLQQIAKIEEQLSQLLLQTDVNAFCDKSYHYIKKLCDTLPLNQERLHDYLMKLLLLPQSHEYMFIQQCLSNVRKTVLCILQQFPTAVEFVYLIQ